MRGLAPAIVGLALAAGTAGAAELHTLFDARCGRTTGVLVHVDAERVALVDVTDGALIVRPREALAGIAIHKTLENPLARIQLGPGLRAHLRDVWVGDDAAPSFTGWTTGFFDELFLYVDLEGQTHVLDPEEIQRLRPAALPAPVVTPRVHAAVELAFPAALVPCGTETLAPGAILPSQVIVDRIKVGDYLGKLEERYRAHAGFEERTRVYARPFVFDLDSRLGILYDPEWRIPFPLYARWSSGRPYRFQSLNVLGNARHEWLPFAGPTMSARSDVKSHFFNGTFVGHILSLPAGTNAFLLDDPPDLGPGDAPDVAHSYNYLLLMGGDFWRLSASVGAAYLSSRVTVAGADPRTVAASSASPTARVRYQGDVLQLRALYFRTRTSGAVFEALGLDPDDVPAGGPRYSFRMDTVRAGARFTPFASVEVEVDQIVSRGRYDDALVERAPVALGFWELTTSVELAVSFGRYVRVRGNARLSVVRTEVTLPTASEDQVIDPRFGGALEFIF